MIHPSFIKPIKSLQENINGKEVSVCLFDNEVFFIVKYIWYDKYGRSYVTCYFSKKTLSIHSVSTDSDYSVTSLFETRSNLINHARQYIA